MVSSYRQKKLIQRFLAAVAAFLFVVSDLFFPVAVEAFVPAPVIPLVQAAVPAGLTASGSTALLPLVVGGLAIGAAYYFWTQSQTEQASELAKDKYCALYPSASVCIPPTNWTVKYSYTYYTSPGTTFYTTAQVTGVPTFSTLPYPNDAYSFYIFDSTNKNLGAFTGGNPVIIAYCAVTAFGDGFQSGQPPNSTACSASSIDPTAWKNWPETERNTATSLLTNSDLDPILQSNPGGSLASGQQLNDGAWVAPNETSDFQFVPGPITISAPDFDGDGEPDSTDSDDDNDSTLDLSDPDPKNPNIPAPNPNPNPSPSPSPSPNNSPPPPNPDAPPSPLPAPAPPPAVTFEPVQPAIFNGVNFVSYGIQKFSTKFPFDIFGDLPTDTPNECPTFSFFGQTQELCIIKNFLSALKWPVIIGFLVWGVLFI